MVSPEDMRAFRDALDHVRRHIEAVYAENGHLRRQLEAAQARTQEASR